MVSYNWMMKEQYGRVGDSGERDGEKGKHAKFCRPRIRTFNPEFRTMLILTYFVDGVVTTCKVFF